MIKKCDSLQSKINIITDWNNDKIKENKELKDKLETLTFKNEELDVQSENLHAEIERLGLKIDGLN